MANKVKRSDHPRIVGLYIGGESKADIGRKYGVGREYIRQIIDEHDPEADEKRERLRQVNEVEKERRRQEIQAQRFLDRLQEVIDQDIRCVVCGGWVIRKVGGKSENKTCSPECAEAWRILRKFPEISGDGHRISMAQSILRHPDTYDPSQIEWAKKMVNEAPPPNRRWVVEGSKRAEVLKKYRPEIYEKLVKDGS